MNVCYLGPLKDYSGYGEANRHDVAALTAAGVDVYCKLVTYVNDPADFGSLGTLIDGLSETVRDYRIKILHTTPDQFPKHHEPGKYHIGRVFWETDKLPDGFAEGVKCLDEIWTGSKANVAAIKAAGIDKPVFVIPQAIEIERPAVEPYKIMDVKDDTFVFYSIFEWTERKNPRALIGAFYDEFRKNEKVALLLKTYYRDFTAKNKKMISLGVADIKKKHNGNKPVMLYKELMDRSQIWRFHKTGDVFVSANHGEGWGLPIVEAMLAGKAVITTGYGGVAEYLTPAEGVVLPYQMAPVRGMNSGWYSPDQKWADVDVPALRAAMRQAYMKKKEAAAMGGRGQRFVIKRFSPAAVGSLMAERLLAIEGNL